LTRRQF